MKIRKITKQMNLKNERNIKWNLTTQFSSLEKWFDEILVRIVKYSR